MPASPTPERPLAGDRLRPRVWALLGGKRGDDDQVQALGQALGWPLEEKNLVYNGLYRSPNVLLGATLRSLSPAARSQIAGPWPELVIAAGRRSAPVAHWIQRQSGSRLVHIGRPRAPLRWFDLVVTTPQYGLPQSDNVLHLPLPLQRTAEIAEGSPPGWAEKAAALPQPRTGVLVGGSTWPFLLDEAAVRSLAEDLNRRLAGPQGSVLITTSPRSAPGIAETLVHHLACPHLLHAWRAGEANPYRAILTAADQFLVTSDSVSMLAEACRTGKAVAIWPVPQRRDPWSRLRLSVSRQAGSHNPLGKLLHWTTAKGFFWPPRSVDRFVEGLVAAGQASWFDPTLPFDSLRSGEVQDGGLPKTVARVRAMFGNTVPEP